MDIDFYDIAIIGGGASGFFAAITAAAASPNKRIGIFESSPNFLSKVRISGGGRCNVTHNLFEPSAFVQNYPRGSKELRSPFTKFQALDTVNWFKEKGVKLVAEEDGRMFPSTNSSETIIKCFMQEALKLNIELKSRSPVKRIEKEQDCFKLALKNEEVLRSRKVLIATGSSKAGYKMAEALGHTITELAPSLFSFKIPDPLLKGLSGTSFSMASINLKLGSKKFTQTGPLLITHHGLSGPAILKLSAWAAREMKHCHYQASLRVNWGSLKSAEEASSIYSILQKKSPKGLIKNARPHFFTTRFWESFLVFAGIDGTKIWSDISKKDLARLSELTFSSPLKVSGQNRFKEEFVECGGVKLSEIDFKTMESRLTPNLYFSGEILDIDGITGGFNFQNAWTTGFLSGKAMAMD